MNRLFFPLIAAPLLLSACGETKTYTDKDGNSVEVSSKHDGDDVNVNIKSKDGNVTIKAGDSVDANAKLPYDLPLMPGSTISAQAAATDESGEKGTMVSFTTDRSADDAFAFYRKALTDAGFKVENEMSSNDMRMMGGKRDDEKGVAVTVTKGSGDAAGKTNVMIIASHD